MPKIQNLNIIKKIKKDYKTKLMKDIKIFLEKKKEKKLTIWSRTFQKSLRR